jgi:hypothetical protein
MGPALQENQNPDELRGVWFGYTDVYERLEPYVDPFDLRARVRVLTLDVISSSEWRSRTQGDFGRCNLGPVGRRACMIENPLKSELVQSRAFRRAVAFVIGIGVPALAALWFRQPGGMLLGAITAIMFSFADEEGPLTKRFTALGRSAGGIALGGAIGHLLGGYDWAFWMLFVAGAFGAAWLNRADKSAHIGARLAVMALAIVAGTPDISWPEALFVVGSLAVTVLVRLADHAVFGPLPAASLPPRPVVPESDRFWLRFAAAYTAAATLGLWAGLELDPQHAMWVVITTLVVMQPDDRSNYRRILERIIGTPGRRGRCVRADAIRPRRAVGVRGTRCHSSRAAAPHSGAVLAAHGGHRAAGHVDLRLGVAGGGRLRRAVAGAVQRAGGRRPGGLPPRVGRD